MKMKLEEVAPPIGNSYSISVNPKMSDLFFWHFHPEFELVFFKGESSNRHVGKHISKFEFSDLVFIGPYIPHLNFDFGVKSDYEKIVIHLRSDFLKNNSDLTPEFENITKLLKLSEHGLAFGEDTKNLLEKDIFNLPNLSGFVQFMELLRILNCLMESKDKELLHSNPVKNQYTHKDHIRIKKIYEYIDFNYQHKIELNSIASEINLTNAAFCRYFKKMTRLTFVQFVNHYRIDKAKNLLLKGSNVTEACFECGFESLSYFNRVFKRVTGNNPRSFKKEFEV